MSEAIGPVLDFDTHADVCIIGQEPVAILVAQSLAGRGWSVVVLGSDVAIGVDAMPAVIAPAFRLLDRRIRDRMGAARAAEHFAVSIAASERLVALARREPALEASAGQGLFRIDRAPAGGQLDTVATMIRRRFGHELEPLDKAALSGRLGRDTQAGALFDPGAMIVDRNALLGQLAKTARHDGARLFSGSPVTSIDVASLQRRVVTARGSVRAGHVIRLDLAGRTWKTAYGITEARDGAGDAAVVDLAPVGASAIVRQGTTHLLAPATLGTLSRRATMAALATVRDASPLASHGPIMPRAPRLAPPVDDVSPLIDHDDAVTTIRVPLADDLVGAAVLALTLERLLVDRDAEARRFATTGSRPRFALGAWLRERRAVRALARPDLA